MRFFQMKQTFLKMFYIPLILLLFEGFAGFAESACESRFFLKKLPKYVHFNDDIKVDLPEDKAPKTFSFILFNGLFVTDSWRQKQSKLSCDIYMEVLI